MNTKFIKDREEEITEPFKGDLWGRKQLSEKLTHFISNLKCGATIALDAEWGAGKTWFVKNWKADLALKKYKVIYIDAFMHDFMEDPFLILSAYSYLTGHQVTQTDERQFLSHLDS